MKLVRIFRHVALILSGVGLLLQAGCTTTQFFDFLNTAFLGVIAAGSVAVIQNL